MGMQWIKPDGTSQTWHDAPAAPIKTNPPTKQAWRLCDWLVVAVGIFAFACACAGVFS